MWFLLVAGTLFKETAETSYKGELFIRKGVDTKPKILLRSSVKALSAVGRDTEKHSAPAAPDWLQLTISDICGWE